MPLLGADRRAWPRGVVAGLLLGAVVVLLVLAGIDSGLERLQRPGQPAFGMGDLADGLPGDVGDAEAALGIWREYDTGGGPGYREWGTWYVGLDFVLVVLYVLALRSLLLTALAERGGDTTRARRWAARLLVAIVAIEVVENVAQLALVRSGWSAPLAHVAVVAALGKWLALALTIVILALLRLEPRTVPSDAPWRPRELTEETRAGARDARRAWAPLRVPLVLVAVFALTLVAPVSDQPPDVLRRWLDGTVARGAVALAGLLLAAAFALTIWLSARRIVLYVPFRASCSPAPLLPLVAAAAAAVVAILFAAERLWGLVAVLAGAALLTLLAGTRLTESEPWPAGRTKNVHDAGQKQRIRQRARALSAAVVAVTGLGCVRAFTEPVFLLPAFEASWWWHTGGLVAAAPLVVGGTLGWYVLLRRLDGDAQPDGIQRDPDRQELRYWLLALPLVALAVATWISVLWLPRALGAFGVLCLAFAVLTLLTTEIARVVERQVPLRAFRVLGFTRTPAFILLAIWLVIGSALDQGGHHDVRRIASERPAPPSLTAAFATWERSACRPADGAATPLLLVANSGGGIRAAYWTASVVEGLLAEARCERPLTTVFAASGISGGSLGLVTVASPPPDRGFAEALGADHLAPALARLAFGDTVESFVGIGGADRAEILERSWEEQNDSLAQAYAGLSPPTVLLLNGTTVETGCRFNASRLDLGAEPSGDLAPDCRTASEYLRRPAPAVATLDLDDFLCAGEDVRRSTAALLSARFPLVSPSGRVEQCASPRGVAPAVTHVVDGGYLDRTGAAALLDVWQALEPVVAARDDTDDCLLPVFVQVENTYQPTGAPRPVGRREELVAPLAAYLAVNANRESAVMTSAQVEFTGAGRRFVRLAPTQRPGVEAPLGWVLSSAAKRDLDGQLAALRRGDDWRFLRDLLQGRVGCEETGVTGPGPG